MRRFPANTATTLAWTLDLDPGGNAYEVRGTKVDRGRKAGSGQTLTPSYEFCPPAAEKRHIHLHPPTSIAGRGGYVQPHLHVHNQERAMEQVLAVDDLAVACTRC